MAESYFAKLQEAQGGKTSDNTLAPLSHYERKMLLQRAQNVSPSHLQGRAQLKAFFRFQFAQFLFELEHFHLIFYGFGSKRELLNALAQELSGDVFVFCGYAQQSLKQLLALISSTLSIAAPTGLIEHATLISRSLKEQIYIIIHSLDGAALRDDRAIAALDTLADSPCVRVISSVDHINAAMAWPRTDAVWHDLTTFDPYTVEALHDDANVYAQIRSHAGAVHVLSSLTQNARGIFGILAQAQIDGQSGMAFNALYNAARDKFLVSNQSTFRAQLTEFRDHELMVTKNDDSEILSIPFQSETIAKILSEINMQ